MEPVCGDGALGQVEVQARALRAELPQEGWGRRGGAGRVVQEGVVQERLERSAFRGGVGCLGWFAHSRTEGWGLGLGLGLGLGRGWG